MMITCATDAVRLLDSCIADKVGPQRYKLWFKNATNLTLTDDFLRIEVPNLFIGNWIEKHCLGAIREAVREVVEKDLEIVFSIDPNLAKQLRRKQPDFQLKYADAHPARLARTQKRNGTTPSRPPLAGRMEDFVVGESNRLAYTCAKSVAEYPATQFNPLFIHGGCGIGKTHLLQAICNELKVRHPAARWAYVSGEDFTNRFVFAVKNGERDAFRQHFRRLDVLVIDDIHFFANKRATQEEFLHTFNAIDATGKQIIMASDAHPKLIGHLSDSLVSRFVSGMVVRIDTPDYETRIGVLRKRASKFDFAIPDIVVEYIAENFRTNIRELEGALLKLVALSRLSGEPLTVGLAQRALSDMIAHTVPVVKLTDIESVVSIYFGLNPADLHTSRKTRTIALARGTAMFLARKHTKMSFPEIGRFMGNKNHSTVILACRRIHKLLDSDEPVRWNTPAGLKERCLRPIVGELEEQLALPTNGTVNLAADTELLVDSTL
ncbi:MAG: chromosomal replication initiator protein DnaA [Phycisphaerales bacterium]|nr:chromosomal replication initiator protein DnaA [Phycisphaerales bacterium]